MISSCEGGRYMESSYALCIKDGLKVKNNYNTNYYLPIQLDILDHYFTTMKPEQILAMLRAIDPVLQLTSLDQLSIKKVVDEKYIDEKYTEIITDKNVLEFSVEMVLVDPKKGEKAANVLLNHLLPFQKRIVSEEFKHAIDVLSLNKFEFLKLFSKLPYNEQRIVRTILSKQAKLEKSDELEISSQVKLEKKHEVEDPYHLKRSA